MKNLWREVRHYLRGALLLLTLAACGQSSGCSGCAQDGEPFPDKDRIHSAVQVRLTEHGLAFLEDNLTPILEQAIPDGLNICIPGQGGDIIGIIQWGVCDQACPGGERGCPTNIELGAIDIQALEEVEPRDDQARLRAIVNFAALAVTLDIFADPIVDCSVIIDAPGFPVQVDLLMTTPDPTRDLTFRVENPVYDLRQLNIRLQGNEGFLSPLCDLLDGVINFPFIGDFILQTLQGFIDGQLAGLINGFVEDFTCRTCEADVDCPREQGGRCVGGRCMLGGVCMPAPLGVEGTLDIGQLMSGFSPGMDAKVQYLATPGSYVQVEQRGLSLGMIGGAVSQWNRCVPRRPQPANVEPPRAETLRTNLAPNGEAYEVGLGISQVFIDHFLWAAFNSGTLCLTVGPGVSDQISTSTIGIPLPGLRELAGGDAPMAITLSPQEIPTARFGANVIEPDPDNEGQYVMVEPLLTVEIPDLWIDFHLFMDQRWVRVFSLGVDLAVPIGVAFTPDNGLIPIIGDLSEGLQNPRTANGEIMTDDPERLVGFLPVILRIAVPALTAGLADPIQLPDIMGYRLDMQDGSLGGIEEDTFLGVFTNLEPLDAEGNGGGARFSVETTVELLDVHVPETQRFVIDSRDTWRRPWLRIGVDAWDGTLDDDGGDPAMEFSWRVDEASWSLFTPAREMVIRDPLLLLQGHHRLQVRARRQDDYRTLDPTPAELTFVIDSMAPTLSAVAAGDAIVIEVSDQVSAADDLVVEARADAGEWRPVEGLRFPIGDAREVTVRVTDEGGNQTQVTVPIDVVAGLIGRPPYDERSGGGGGCGGGGCAAAGRADAPWGLILLALLPFGLLALRRRWRAALAVAVLGFFLGGCSDDGRKKRDGTEDGGPGAGGDTGSSVVCECERDEQCTEANHTCVVGADGCGTCRILDCGDDPAICDALKCDGGRAAICNEMNVCECEPFCAAGCGEGEFCCLAENECRPVPEACLGVECDPGLVLSVTQEGRVNPDTCELEDVECECVAPPPLDEGTIGRHSDLVVIDGAAYVSAYAESYGDLVVGRWVDDAFSWWWVDGVPGDGALTAAPDGPRGGTAERGDDVGLYTAMAAGPDGQLHVAYFDRTNHALKYALGQPEGDGYRFTTLTLDDEGDAGRFASISVDARGVPGIAYRVARVRSADAWVSEVRYVLAKNAAPSAPADWVSPFTLHQRMIDLPCGGRCARGETCVAETNTCGRLTETCGGCEAGLVCVEDACQATVSIDSGALPPDYPDGTGVFTSQSRDPNGFPVVAWYDRTVGTLFWSRFADAGFGEPAPLAGWGTPVTDADGTVHEGDMGINVDLALDAEGNAHLCFQDGMTDSLRYLAPELGFDHWVDNGIRDNSDGRQRALHVVGEDCNMRLDADGHAVIVYQDATSQEVLMARHDGTGGWRGLRLRGHDEPFEGSYGFYTRARVAGGLLWVTSFFIDNQNEPHDQGLDLFTFDL